VIFRRTAPPGFSIVCAWNNRETLDRFLLASLRNQTFPYELLLIDNRNGEFKNAARILNETARNAKFDRLIFIHQDVALNSPDWLSNVWKTLSRRGRFGAAGAAGRNSKGMFASVTHGHPPQSACPEQPKRPVRVQTLDGCLMIVPKNIFLKQGFDEEICNGWYLYIANYCLDLHRRRLKAYVLPHGIYHESMGPADPAVYESAKENLLKKHRNDFKTVYTTIGIWKT
jgi:hypothetical protein